jgi:SRSO17 transposase
MHHEQKTVAPEAAVGEQDTLGQLAERVINFCQRFTAPFQSRTHSREEPLLHYLKGLLQGDKGKRNMERMAERVPEADEQSLQHFISEAQWSEREVLDLVALEADKALGGRKDSCLVVDESGFDKKGMKSVGVARQWNGNLGKVDNSQVGVFLALASGNRATLIDEQLYLPKEWIDAPMRCLEAGIPEDKIVFKTKQEQALEMIYHAKKLGVRYNWVNFDGFYGEDPAFLRMLDSMGETFMGDVHKDQQVYLEDPKPVVPPRQAGRGRTPSRLKAQSLPLRVDELARHQPPQAWRRVKLRDSSKGVLFADILHRRVWLWDGEEAQAHCWHLVVRREVASPTEIKYSLSNAAADTPLSRLAFMQGQRYWVERALQDGKQECGLADYQVRKWRGWHHHMALSMMVMLFMLEERLLNQAQRPLLSCSDIRILLGHFLPRRDATTEEVVRQMEVRHRKRQAAIDSAYKKQENQSVVVLDG